MRRFIARCAQQKAGWAALEFGLIFSLISLAVVGGARIAGTSSGAIFAAIGAIATSVSTNVAAV